MRLNAIDLLKVLKERYNYNPKTGYFIRKISRNRFKPDEIAGTVGPGGYIVIRINKSGYYAHRLAYLFINGYLPLGPLDHINRIKDDNRISNLRLSNPIDNGQNRDKTPTNSTSKLLGVRKSRHKGKWQAQIKAFNVNYHLGTFTSKESAHEAYLKAKRKLHKSFR